MPALPPVANVIRSEFKHTLQGDVDLLNRCYWEYTGTTTGTSLFDMAEALAAAWHTNLHPLMVNVATLENVQCMDLTTTSSPVADYAPGTTGGISTAYMAAGSAAVLQFEIARRYRGGKPKMFIGGLSQSQIATTQTWNATFLADLFEAWTALAAGVLDAEYGGITTISHQVNVSYYEGFTNTTGPTGRAKTKPTPRETPLVDIITGYSVNPNIASQRRRNETP